MVRGVHAIRQVTDPLVQQLADLHRLAKTIKTAEEERKLIQATVVENYRYASLKTKTYLEDGFRIKATLVPNERVVIDEERLKKALGADLWEKATTRKVDRAKVEQLIAEGKIDPVTVAACSESKEYPYIKFTESKAPDEEEAD